MIRGKRAGQSVVEVTLLAAMVVIVFVMVVFGLGRELKDAAIRSDLTEGVVQRLDDQPAHTTTILVGKVPVPRFWPEQFVVTVGGWDVKQNKAVTVPYTVTQDVFRTLHVGDRIQTAILVPPS